MNEPGKILQDPLLINDVQIVQLTEILSRESTFETIKEAIGEDVLYSLQKGLVDPSDAKETALRNIMNVFEKPQRVEDVLTRPQENIKSTKTVRGPHRIDVISSSEYLDSLKRFHDQKKQKKIEKEAETVEKLSTKLANKIKKEGIISTAEEKRRLRKEAASAKALDIQKQKENRLEAKKLKELEILAKKKIKTEKKFIKNKPKNN